MPSHSSDLRHIIAETTAQIEHFQSLIANLLAKRELAQLQLDSIVYPVLTLPPEITSEIFYHCLPASHHWNSADPGKAPMLLTHVCRAWREIALSTPALWAEFAGLRSSGNYARIFETWLSRAGTLPLSIRLHAGYLDLGDDIFQTFARCSCKVRSLELSMRDKHFHEMERARDRWSFPLLQILELHGDRFQMERPIELFIDSPRLREVSIKELPPLSISLPWQQLTKFASSLWTVADCLKIFCLIPNLKECTFANCELEEDPDLPVLSHSNLQSLTLLDDDGFIIGLNTLNFLSLPALRTFVLEFSVDELAFEDIFNAFLSRSSPPLRKFSFSLLGFTDFDITLLSRTSKLVELEISNPSIRFMSDFFESFKKADTTFLPQLEHLTFLDCQTDVLKLSHPGLSARWYAQHRAEFARLETVRLEFSESLSNFPEDALLPFQKLAADGMNICIKGGNDIRDFIPVVE
ncbi:hypothetical protein B0H17DRAFT_226921 [Mycena rosella]|uniref:F-box domain-containing protein n=1 Tax=Mycena rosella TaxID=1033263 RepID=A0AAD7MBH4_MYCRO|nr:hypothetical protein B0H17DRAFT_226921 [Mycena rosella]